ncbi:unnamed protein product (mitochondrion) [Plasmodiophora brassicae]|uniref:N-acetyltransferase domain-containing protein n=1 Tax=Plasmodiophora brassicae TaxID=37360 RepID=A0A3P3YKZ1_PLABS|nr:unnamed protein product [Plasmodiophora brassicae]
MDVRTITDASDERVAQVLELARDVFQDPSSPILTMEAWRERFRLRGRIHYAHDRRDPGRLQGFVFVHDRGAGVHVWLAGTRAEHRRSGVMSALFDVAESSEPVPVVTVNTYPDRFRHMPRFLDARQYVLQQEVPTDQGRKWCYVKRCPIGRGASSARAIGGPA